MTLFETKMKYTKTIFCSYVQSLCFWNKYPENCPVY